MDRIADEKDLSPEEQLQLATDKASCNLLEENRMLAMAKPETWPEPNRSVLLNDTYQKSPAMALPFSFRLRTFLTSVRFRRVVTALALIMILAVGNQVLNHNSQDWVRIQGYELTYRLDEEHSSDEESTRELIRQLASAGLSGENAVDKLEFMDSSLNRHGEMTMTMRLSGCSARELADLDKAMSGSVLGSDLSISHDSWFSYAGSPGRFFQERIVTINDREVMFPLDFTLEEASRIDTLMSAISDSEMQIEGLTLGDRDRFGIGSVVSVEKDRSGNLTIVDSSRGETSGDSLMNFSDVIRQSDKP